ncbi:hypothetical protein Tco_1285478 [Tanacetum coccineum]
MESLNSNSQEREMHQLQQMQDKAKEKCMESFRLLHSHLKVLSIKGGFERACGHNLNQDNQTFTESICNDTQVLSRIYSTEIQQSLVIAVKEGKGGSSKALDAGLVVTESNETESERHVSSSRSGKDTHAEDADINSVNDKQPLAETYKDLYDSIKKMRVQTKDHNDSLIAQINSKTVENADLKAQIQEKGKKSAFCKPNHMIASSSSRNSSKNMPRFSSNDMVHNYYLEEAKKKTQERDRKSTTSVMSSAKSQNTTKSCKSKPRSNNQTSRVLPTSKSSCPTTTVMPKADHSRNSSPFSDFKHFVCSTCQKCVFNANHDACITKFLKEEFSS